MSDLEKKLDDLGDRFEKSMDRFFAGFERIFDGLGEAAPPADSVPVTPAEVTYRLKLRSGREVTVKLPTNFSAGDLNQVIATLRSIEARGVGK